jgi:MOSC domain-containing protein YiiM
VISSPPAAAAALGVVRSIQVGRIAPLGPDAVPSAFIKKPVSGAVLVDTLGIAGDEQADLRVHGGRDKAVYSYALSNYSVWRSDFPQYAGLFAPGAFGENLTVDGCDEHGVCVGDTLRVGEAVLEVTEPRQPCYKFALRFGDISMPRAMIQNGLCGWYCRVIRAGRISAGQELILDARPHADWSIWRVNRLIVQRRGTPAERAEFAAIAASLR